MLSSLLTTRSVQEAQGSGLVEESFQVEAHREAFRYLCSRAALGQTATKTDVEIACGITLLEDLTDSTTFVEHLVKRGTARRAYNAIATRVDEIAHDPVTAVRALAGDLVDITSPVSGVHERNLTDGVRQRLVELSERIKTVDEVGRVGIPTGLSFFEDQQGSWMPGDLVAIIGATNAGKSWLLTMLCVTAYLSGSKILYFSPEMTASDIDARADVLVANRLGVTLSNRALRNGTQDVAAFEEYADALEKRDLEPWITRDSGDAGFLTLDDILAQTREHRPDIVAIDGFHLIEIGGGKASWESIARASKAIKGLAMDLGITVLTVAQAQRGATLAADDTPGLGQMAYGMALAEAADIVLSLAEKRGQEKQRIYKVPKNRAGLKTAARRYLKFDVDSGNLREQSASPDLETGETTFD